MIQYYLLIPFALFAIATLLASSFHSSFAQQQSQVSNTTELNTTSTSIPVLEQVSEKGIYRVQLKWPQVGPDAQHALQVEIDFLNATSPVGTNATVPHSESNFSRGSGTRTGLTVPNILDSPLAVKSYDMIVSSSDGKELWKKTDQPGLGGRGTQRIILNTNYTGPVTIDIKNIQPGWDTGGTTIASSANNMTDSVKFNATIVR